MNEPILIYEAADNPVFPTLRPYHPNGPMLGEKETEQLTDLIKPKYNAIVTSGTGTVQFQGYTVALESRRDETGGRCSRLELRCPELESRLRKSEPAKVRVTGWYAGFLAELAPLYASSEFAQIERLDQKMLELVREDLQAYQTRFTSQELAVFMLLAMLVTGEMVNRETNDYELYSVALRGLESLYGHAHGGKTPWGNWLNTRNAAPSQLWLVRIFAELFRSRKD